MCVSLTGTWIRTLRHGAAGVLHSGVDCVVHLFTREIDIQKSIVISVMIYTQSNSVEDKHLRYAKLPPFPCYSHLIIRDLAYLARSACLAHV